jgi:L-asparaginase
MAGETTSAKARLLLMYILSQPSARELQQEDAERFRAYLQETLDPVLSDRLFVG